MKTQNQRPSDSPAGEGAGTTMESPPGTAKGTNSRRQALCFPALFLDILNCSRGNKAPKILDACLRVAYYWGKFTS